MQSPYGSPFDLDRELTRRTSNLLDAADDIRVFCDENDLPYPAVLRSIFGRNQVHRDIKPENFVVLSHPPDDRADFKVPSMPGPRPAGAPDNSLPLPIPAVTVGTLALYIVHRKNGPMVTKELLFELRQLRPIEPSTFSMTMKTLVQEGYLTGDGTTGWRLAKPISATRVGDKLWLPVTQLRSKDKAVVRREAIIETLRLNGPMQIFRIAECLNRADWLQVPTDSNLIKSDLRLMNEVGRVVKDGIVWRLPNEEEKDQQQTPP